MLDNRHKILIGGLLAVLIASGLLFRSWLSEHDARLQAETATKVDQASANSAAAQIKILQDADVERAKETAATLAAMQTLVASVKSAPQIAQWLPQQVALPQPITVNVPQATPGNPTPDATAQIPQSDLPALRDAVEGCKECAATLESSQADVASRDQQLKDAGEKLSATQDEVTIWKVAAKGTFWSRTKTALKYVGIGALVGVAAVCGSGHCK